MSVAIPKFSSATRPQDNFASNKDKGKLFNTSTKILAGGALGAAGVAGVILSDNDKKPTFFRDYREWLRSREDVFEMPSSKNSGISNIPLKRTELEADCAKILWLEKKREKIKQRALRVSNGQTALRLSKETCKIEKARAAFTEKVNLALLASHTQKVDQALVTANGQASKKLSFGRRIDPVSDIYRALYIPPKGTLRNSAGTYYLFTMGKPRDLTDSTLRARLGKRRFQTIDRNQGFPAFTGWIRQQAGIPTQLHPYVSGDISYIPLQARPTIVMHHFTGAKGLINWDAETDRFAKLRTLSNKDFPPIIGMLTHPMPAGIQSYNYKVPPSVHNSLGAQLATIEDTTKFGMKHSWWAKRTLPLYSGINRFSKALRPAGAAIAIGTAIAAGASVSNAYKQEGKTYGGVNTWKAAGHGLVDIVGNSILDPTGITNRIAKSYVDKSVTQLGKKGVFA